MFVLHHRRIQDFVRGGGQGPLGPRGGGPRPSWPAPHYLGEQYFVGRGGGPRPPWPPPGSAHVHVRSHERPIWIRHRLLYSHNFSVQPRHDDKKTQIVLLIGITFVLNFYFIILDRRKRCSKSLKSNPCC